MKVINLNNQQEENLTAALQAIYNIAEENEQNYIISELVNVLELLNIEIYM